MAPGQKVAATSQRLWSISLGRLQGTLKAVNASQTQGNTPGQLSPSRTTSTATTSALRADPFSVGDILQGSSGRSYNIEEILADRRKPLLCVYRRGVYLIDTLTFRVVPKSNDLLSAGSAQGNKYVIKNIIKDGFEYQQTLKKPLSGHPNLRALVDTIPDGQLFVYPFLRGDLLRFASKPLSDDLRKDILRSALIWLVELHDRNIIHSGA